MAVSALPHLFLGHRPTTLAAVVVVWEIVLQQEQAVAVAGAMAHDLPTQVLIFLEARLARQTQEAVAVAVAPVVWRMEAAPVS